MSDETGQPHLSAVDLEQSFQIGRARIDVLKRISLEVRSGEVVFLCGASGAGKTSTLRSIAGITTPDEGRIVLGETVFFDSAAGIHLPPNTFGSPF
jgi:ABC-type sulfate/molybdate transport systems ATPase subunit